MYYHKKHIFISLKIFLVMKQRIKKEQTSILLARILHIEYIRFLNDLFMNYLKIKMILRENFIKF